MIIDFKNILLAFPWRPHGPGHKQITEVWKSIFSIVLVMSAFQNETLWNCVNHAVAVPVSSYYRDLVASLGAYYYVADFQVVVVETAKPIVVETRLVKVKPYLGCA